MKKKPFLIVSSNRNEMFLFMLLIVNAVWGYPQPSDEQNVTSLYHKQVSSEFLNVPVFSINHGPYLQEVTSTGATFVFQTSAPSFSSIELKKEGSDLSAYYAHSEHGLKAANETFFSVRADDLLPNTVYQYRIHSKEMKSFQAYKVEFGDSIVSRWYTFRTVNPKQKGGSIFITSDMHSDPGRLKNLLNLCDYKTCTSFSMRAI